MMKITEALKARRSYYAINRELPVAIDRVMDMVCLLYTSPSPRDCS